MRVTFNNRYNGAQQNIDSAAARLNEFQRQVSSGKRVEKPSDDPAAAALGIVERANLGNIERYQRAADSVTSRQTIIDTALSDIVSQLTSAQVTATAARGSTKSAAEREAAATQLESIRSALLSDFNTSFHGTYVFAGAMSTTAPYVIDNAGVVAPYAGSATEVQVDVTDHRAVTVGFNGETIAKGSASTDVFGVINNLIQAARAGDDAALGVGSDALRNAFDRVTTAQARLGSDMKAVEGEKARLDDTKLAADTRLNQLEDANLAEVIPAMNQADSAYRAALGAMSTASKVSLMDYLG